MSRRGDAELVALAQVVEPRLRLTPRGLHPLTGDYARWDRLIGTSPDREYALWLDGQMHAAVHTAQRRDLRRWLTAAALSLGLAGLVSATGLAPGPWVAGVTAVSAIAAWIVRTVQWERIEHAHDAVCPLDDDEPEARPS